MRNRMRINSLLATLFVALLVASCAAEPTPTSRPHSPTTTPDISATVEAQVRATIQAASILTPTLAPLSPEDRAEILAFAQSHRQITGKWEQFHIEFDVRREGLVACTASSMEEALRGFASEAATITAQVRALPRLSPVRDLANRLIDAAEAEERSLRELRDTWTPDAPRTKFENVDVERTAAAAVQKEIQDSLLDLTERTSASSRQQLNTFSQTLDALNTEWDRFHEGYNQFLAQEADLTSSQFLLQLSQQIQGLSEVTTRVRNLLRHPLTAPISDILLIGAEQEELALRKLRDSFQKFEPPPAPPSPPGAPPPPTSEVEEETTFRSRDPLLFEAFGAQLVTTNTQRSQALEELARIRREASSESQTAIEEFSNAYASLAETWNTFHSGYDDWRRTEGGCDRSEAIAILGQFTLTFGELTRQTRDIPAISLLRPLGELLVEAAEREESALRDLRNNWRPFDAQVYAGFDRERIAAGKLLRQVIAGLNNLLAQHNITLPET